MDLDEQLLVPNKADENMKKEAEVASAIDPHPDHSSMQVYQ